jgi:hypothetical protein
MRYKLNIPLEFHFYEASLSDEGRRTVTAKGSRKIWGFLKERTPLGAGKGPFSSAPLGPQNDVLRPAYDVVIRAENLPYDIEKIVWKKDVLTPLMPPISYDNNPGYLCVRATLLRKEAPQ